MRELAGGAAVFDALKSDVDASLFKKPGELIQLLQRLLFVFLLSLTLVVF
jgi:hypothetical protein